MYPSNDKQFSDLKIIKVDEVGGGFEMSDGWSFCCPKDSPVKPGVGMRVRLYGQGAGGRVRGLFLDGVKVFYRTKAEDREQSEIELYGEDAADWLRRWDDGMGVWSIEMGGLGPGYEQCIHITAAEILRYLLKEKYVVSAWDDKDSWERTRDEIEKMGFANPTIKALGLSGAQWGAALSLAINFYKQGPRGVMTDEQVKDRHIQVQKTFPMAA